MFSAEECREMAVTASANAAAAADELFKLEFETLAKGWRALAVTADIQERLEQAGPF